MAFVVPNTWKFHSSSQDGNAITFTRPGHTVKEPRLALMNRVLPSYDAARNVWSTPSVRLRIFDGVLDADGKPDPVKTTFDGTWRYSINSDGSARADEVNTDLITVIDQPDFVPEGVVKQSFPTVAP